MLYAWGVNSMSDSIINAFPFCEKLNLLMKQYIGTMILTRYKNDLAFNQEKFCLC